MGASLLAVAKSMYYCKYKPTQGCFLRRQLIRLNRRRRGGGGGDEVWDRETMFSQLAKRAPCVVVSGQLQYFSHSKYF